MPKLVRTLTYTGDEEWLQACIDNGFVSLNQELGGGKSITSKWHDPRAQRRASQIHDQRRSYRNKFKMKAFSKMPELAVRDLLDKANHLLEEYRLQHSEHGCTDETIGRSDIGAADGRCDICRELDEMETPSNV